MITEILIIGAGKSATVLIQYLQKKAVQNNWYIVLADGDLKVAEAKWNQAPNGHAIGIDINIDSERQALIQKATVVISMLPPSLHFLVAKDCLLFSKSLFTASYVDENMRTLAAEIKTKELLFLCEMGLDPGIDHMSAMELIHKIQGKGAKITGFKSHCGGLVAPESDNNPWHYKISWNASNIVLAGKAGALYLENGQNKMVPYNQLFQNESSLAISSHGLYAYYPNRNSLNYIDTYALQGITDFVRTTLRHPHFFIGWNAIVQLGLTDETPITLKKDGSVKDWIQTHLEIKNLIALYQSFKENEIIRTQLDFLGLDSKTIIPNSLNSNASILQWILESKWKLDPTDKDLVLMMHEIYYTLNGNKYLVQSSMAKKGKDANDTAMATTVGLPLAMSVCAYLNGLIPLTGLHIPTHPSIYTPILKSLAEEDIVFEETTTTL